MLLHLSQLKTRQFVTEWQTKQKKKKHKPNKTKQKKQPLLYTAAFVMCKDFRIQISAIQLRHKVIAIWLWELLFMQGFISDTGSRWEAIWVQSRLASRLSHIGWLSVESDSNWHKFEIFCRMPSEIRIWFVFIWSRAEGVKFPRVGLCLCRTSPRQGWIPTLDASSGTPS